MKTEKTKMNKEEKKRLKEENKKIKKATRRKLDKMQIATKIIAGIMAILMILGMAASFIYYLIRM